METREHRSGQDPQRGIRLPAGPQHVVVVVTQKLLWAGGELRLNADAHPGELKVRVSDASRRVLPGLDYSDCVPFTCDGLSHQCYGKIAS